MLKKIICLAIILQNGFTDFIRLGQKQRVHSKIIEYMSQEQTKSFTTTQQMKKFFESHVSYIYYWLLQIFIMIASLFDALGMLCCP